MKTQYSLEVAPRSVIGKQVRQLRRDGYIPGVIYGPLAENPISIQVKWEKLRPLLSKASNTSLVNLEVENQTISVLVRDVQRHPVRQDVVLHIDFYAVDVNNTIKTYLPVVVPNIELESKRLAAKIFQPVNRLEVESLPADIPAQITVDLSTLRRAGQNLSVQDLADIPGVTILDDPDLIVVRTVSLVETDDEEIEDGGEIMPEVEVITRGKAEEEEF